MPSPPWRLIIEDAPRSGAANMAVDESIAEAAAGGDVPPTLRFYSWQSPTVSLGPVSYTHLTLPTKRIV